MNKTKKQNSIGFGIEAPSKECTDQKCPFHGNITVKSEFFTGIIIKKDTHNSAVMEWKRLQAVPKYERFEKRRSRIHIHNPPCINAQIGDKVTVAKTKPLSKTKNFVIIKREELSK